MSVILTSKNRTFVDISLSFTPNPLTGDLTTIKNDRAINNSIKNLILIHPNEVPFNRDVGSTTSRLLFEFCDDVTAALLEDEITRTIKFNEPRVELQKVIVEAQPEQNNFNVTVKYKIVGTEQIYIFSEILTPTR
jgi:phage baseplate assembly protein W